MQCSISPVYYILERDQEKRNEPVVYIRPPITTLYYFRTKNSHIPNITFTGRNVHLSLLD